MLPDFCKAVDAELVRQIEAFTEHLAHHGVKDWNEYLSVRGRIEGLERARASVRAQYRKWINHDEDNE